MKKKIRFAIVGTEFTISAVILAGLGTTFILGLVAALVISLSVSDKLFSPLVILSSDVSGPMIFFHSLLYFTLFIIIALVFAASYFGFAVFPLLAFVKGLFTALTIKTLLAESQFIPCFFFYAPLLTLEAGVLLIYFTQCMYTSLGFFKGTKPEPETGNAFTCCLQQFTIIAVVMLILALTCGLWQYFF